MFFLFFFFLYQPMDFKNLKKKICEPKVSRFSPKFCDFQEENQILGFGFKNLQKIYSLAYGYLFFVISISASGYCSESWQEVVEGYRELKQMDLRCH
jgi:hypothetical protein